MGYQVLQDASFLDALDMTIVTVTTVGFREVVEPDGIGRVFTILLIVGASRARRTRR